MISALAALILAAPTSGLAVSVQIGKPPAPLSTWFDPIEEQLVGAKVGVKRLTLACEGKRECLLDGARRASVASIVAVTLSHTKKQTTLDLEAMRVSDGVTVAQVTFTVNGTKYEENARAQVRKFAEQLAEALLAEEKKVSDVPVREPEKKLEVAEVKPAEVGPLTLKVTPRSRVPAYVMGGGAVASGIVSGIFLGLAASKDASLRNTPNPSPYTRPQAEALAVEANGQYTVSLATGIAAGALATAAIIWILTE